MENSTEDYSHHENSTAFFQEFLSSMNPDDLVNFTRSMLGLSTEEDEDDWLNLYRAMKKEQEELESNNRLGHTAHYTLLIIYSTFISLGILGNVAIVLAFLTNKVMLTTRNIFIANLALSDIFLCAFTMPLTLVDLVTKFWTLGENQGFLCKLIGTTQASCIFFSSFSILLIAVDRYRFIVKSNEAQISTKQAFMLSSLALMASITLSSPLFYYTKLEIIETVFTDRVFSYCYEAWSSRWLRLTYTLVCFLTQFLVPSCIVGWGYYRICQTLSQSAVPSTLSSHRRARQMQRRRKTNLMLVVVSVTFFMSWAPLNIFNMVLDLTAFFKEMKDTEDMLIWFATVHLSAMSSACLNPILYGFLNENFKQSIHGIFTKIPIVNRLFRSCSSSQNGSRIHASSPFLSRFRARFRTGGRAEYNSNNIRCGRDASKSNSKDHSNAKMMNSKNYPDIIVTAAQGSHITSSDSGLDQRCMMQSFKEPSSIQTKDDIMTSVV